MERKKYNYRKTDKHFIYGVHPILEALDSGKEFEKILLSRDFTNFQIKEIIQKAAARDIIVQKVPLVKIQSITNANHQGVIAFLSPIEYQNIEDILMQTFEQGKTPFVLILDRVTDVRNFGAIARTAECAGVDCIIIPQQGSVTIHADAIKTSAGALSRIPICRSMNLKSTINYLKSSGLSLIAVTEYAKELYNKKDYTKPIAFILGSEEDGISKEYLKLCDYSVSIPLKGEISSLNVSVATGIILYETVSQRSK